MKTRNVAVIDVGSNTIKLLVASRSADGSLAILQQVSDPTRIGSGIGSESPVLSRDSMLAGLATIAKLLDGAMILISSPCFNFGGTIMINKVKS